MARRTTPKFPQLLRCGRKPQVTRRVPHTQNYRFWHHNERPREYPWRSILGRKNAERDREIAVFGDFLASNLGQQSSIAEKGERHRTSRRLASGRATKFPCWVIHVSTAAWMFGIHTPGHNAPADDALVCTRKVCQPRHVRTATTPVDTHLTITPLRWPATQGLGAPELGYGSRESFLPRPRESAPTSFSKSLPEYSNSGSPQTVAELAMALQSTNGRDHFPLRVSEDEKRGLIAEITP
ncbi:uncharacterized protein BDZ83DRAFT_656853 [Colletotrichum acutatum]|uniref:Uncharacterized protein n=1 Tax=Glomerella acutata TaxID=27357 RepID=A0AAD8UC35_GLOAC|nr:uncharacterized protein BDZ83DRAFT_656853 [Colletotrichum acutatum]KAK1711252.1 hypothetical protein BDZ83DRAFT_656853 [Colletotrichum acutatum]